MVPPLPCEKKSQRLFSQNFRCRQLNWVELFYLIDIMSLCHILQGSILPGQCFTHPPCSGSGEGPRGIAFASAGRSVLEKRRLHQ